MEKSLGKKDKNSSLLHGLHQAQGVQGQERLPSKSSKTHLQPLPPIPILFMKVLWVFKHSNHFFTLLKKKRFFFNL